MQSAMIASDLLPSRFRGEKQPTEAPKPPSQANKKITPVLQHVARLSCLHPIHTICIAALLVSTTYVGMMKQSLLDLTTKNAPKAEWPSMVEGSRSLITGPDSNWNWHPFDPSTEVIPAGAEHKALITMIFPESSVDGPHTAPSSHIVPLPDNLTITQLPPTANSLGAYSQDSTLAFSIPYDEASDFLAAAQEIPNDVPGQELRETEAGVEEPKMWIMKVARGHTRTSLVRWAHNGWIEFLDLIKHAETLDIIIMSLGYLSMHVTFVSLFIAMRRMGSNIWLATSVLLASTFAFLFGLNVTINLGVPVNMVLLSEGLPFLVVTIGFEKKITLTKAVLSHSYDRNSENGSQKKNSKKSSNVPDGPIQYAVHHAIKDKGYEIIRDYAIEILLLVAGALSGISGGLKQFCFLAALILFFDCILLFTFYMAILCVKLETNRFKRNAEMRKALIDDGVSKRVAENVATSANAPRHQNDMVSERLFGPNAASSSVPKFKFWMVVGFFAINAINLCTIPFRATGKPFSSMYSWSSGLGAVTNTPPMDPFKVASTGLDELLFLARSLGKTTVVTILNPIRYELEFPSVHYAIPPSLSHDNPLAGGSYPHLGEYGVGGRMVGGLLTSLEDPLLTKYILIALAISVGLNGYLFNVARWGIKDPQISDRPIDRKELAAAERFNDSQPPASPIVEIPTPKQTMPPTPASTDDEALVPPTPTESEASSSPRPMRSAAELAKLMAEKRHREMTDQEVIAVSLQGKIPGYALEKSLGDCTRAVKVRRAIMARTPATAERSYCLERSALPYQNYDWTRVLGACCENVIGYTPVPVGVAGPLVIDGQSYLIPMATTEGVLVASTSRGSKAINAGGGAVTVLTHDGMTRGPCVAFETLERAGAAKLWLDSPEGKATMSKAFNSTSRFARLQEMKTALAGTNLYIRFKTTTGDAMGMNMISKGVEHALSVMMSEGGFSDMQIITVSGNFCIDKKPAAINWIDGRGKGIVAEAIIPAEAVKSVLKSDVDALVELNVAKNLIGSAMAGSIGGFNAHAANIVAAIFIATGQDPAQVGESANCITTMKNLRGSLQISVSMPSIEVGCLGGGTILEPQGAMLDLLGVRGSHPTNPGENARRLARIIGASVLAGELSLCSALAAGHLVQAHMAHNRSAPPTRATTPAPPGGGPMTPVGLTMTSATEKPSQAALERTKSKQ